MIMLMYDRSYDEVTILSYDRIHYHKFLVIKFVIFAERKRKPDHLTANETSGVYGSNSTWLDSTRLDTFDVSSPCILAVSS